MERFSLRFSNSDMLGHRHGTPEMAAFGTEYPCRLRYPLESFFPFRGIMELLGMAFPHTTGTAVPPAVGTQKSLGQRYRCRCMRPRGGRLRLRPGYPDHSRVGSYSDHGRKSPSRRRHGSAPFPRIHASRSVDGNSLHYQRTSGRKHLMDRPFPLAMAENHFLHPYVLLFTTLYPTNVQRRFHTSFLSLEGVFLNYVR